MMTGNNIGNARTVKSAPRALDLEMIAAINVEPADNPMPPIIKMIRSKKLNINFPRKILIGNATSFSVSAVCFSSSLIKIWDNPDIAEKKRMIHNRAHFISALAENVPIENETETRVTTANRSIALTAVSYTHLTLPTNREV